MSEPDLLEPDRIRRERMVRTQIEARGLAHPRVLAAMRSIPRERFVEEALRGKAYSDRPLPIGESQTISQPWIVARMSELAEPDPQGKVLEIGTGSGYQAAVLSCLFEQVYSVERIPELSHRALRVLRELAIENVHLKIFDGSFGWSEFAPYAAVLVTAAAPELPETLLDQLQEGGRMVLPLAAAGAQQPQRLVRVIKRAGQLIQEEHGECRFVPLLGRYGWNA